MMEAIMIPHYAKDDKSILWVEVTLMADPANEEDEVKLRNLLVDTKAKKILRISSPSTALTVTGKNVAVDY